MFESPLSKFFFAFVDIPRPPIMVDPPSIEKPAWQRFEFICRSPAGSRVSVVFTGDGALVNQDPRFQVTMRNSSYAIVTAPEGLRDLDDLRIEYVTFINPSST